MILYVLVPTHVTMPSMAPCMLWSSSVPEPQDLVFLLHLRLQGKDDEAQKFATDLMKSDWQKVLGKSLQEFQTMPFKEVFSRCQQLILAIPHRNRTPALQDWIDARLSWISPGYSPVALVSDPAKRKMIGDYVNLILSNESGGDANPHTSQRAGPQSMQLAKQIASGALSGQGVLEYLLSAAVQKADKTRRGLTRVNTSALKNCPNPEALPMIAWTLGQSFGKRSVRELFGLNLSGKNSKAATDLRSEIVPQSYIAKGETLVKNVKLAVGYLDAVNQQNYMLAVDETVYSKTWEVAWHRLVVFGQHCQYRHVI